MAAEDFNSLGGYSVGIPPVPVVDANGNVVTNILNTTGNVSVANIYAANYYYANGRPFNAGGNPYGPNNSIQYNSNGQFDGSANLTFDNLTNLLTVTNINVTGLSNLGPVGNVIITGGTTGYLLTTDGNGVLQWSPPGSGSAISNGSSNVNIATLNGNITAGVNGVANVITISSTGLDVTGNITATNFVGNFTGNVANAATAGTVTANAQPNITSVGTLISLDVTGNITAGNVKTDHLLYANGDPYVFTTNAAGANTQVQFNNNNAFSASANFTFDNTSNTLSVTNITANGAGLTSLTGANVTGQVSYSNIANSVAVANVVGIGNIATTNYDGNASNVLHGDGTWSADQTTYSNSNVVSLLSAFGSNSLITTGNVQAGNLFGNGNAISSITGANVTGEVSFANTANSVAVANVVGIGNISVVNLDGNGSNILHGNGYWGPEAQNLNANYANFAGEAFNVSGSNVTGTVANATYALSSNVANTAGTVTTAAQPNITSVGTLTGLTVAGDILPGANVTYNLGSPTLRWKDLYVSGNTIDLNGSTISSDANGITLANPAGGTFTVIGTGASNTASIVNGNSSIVIQPNSEINFNITGASNIVVISGNGLLVNSNANVTGNIITAGTVTATGNITGGNLNTANGVYANTANITANLTSGNANLGNLATANYVNIANILSGNIANFIGNITSLNANLGNLATANYVNIANILTGNIANFSGNLTSLNADLGNLATANYVNVSQVINGNIGNFSGNITSLNANAGNLLTANNVTTEKIFNGNSNITLTPNGNITTTVASNATLTVSGVGANIVGYVQANGIISAGSFEGVSLTSNVGNLTLYAAPGNNYVELRPSGNGQVDVGNFRITSIAEPIAATDAATKQYVDTVAQGLHIHAPSQAATPDTLANVTSGVITYNNGASGVGANLVTTGSFNLIDGVNVQTSGTRILVKNEANTAHNGIYTWANASTIVRAVDFNTPTEMAGGDFTFVQQGTLYNDTGWVMTDPVTTVGTSPVIWVQFSGAGTYSAGPGLTLNGTQFSVNVDNLTTEIAGGNVVVKANSQFTTPNIGAATGTSLNVTGNVSANNISATELITSNNITVTTNANVGNLLTDNLLHANGVPWDFELPGGGNTQLQFNNDGSFGGSANLTFNKDTGNLSINGNVSLANGLYYGDGGGLSNIAAANVVGLNLSQIANGNSNVNIATANGNVTISAVGNANIVTVTGTGANITGTFSTTGLVTIPNTAGGATAIELGSPTQGNLVSNALTLTTSSSVSNAIAQLNVVLGKLVPPSPPNFPAGQSITISSLSTYRMANYVQTDNTPGANKSVAGGTTVTTVRRASSYTTGNITIAGPGDTGTITSFLNGSNAGSRTLTTALDGNGTYSNLVIFNNYDYNVANANIAAGFWSVFSSRTAGTVTEGWNEVFIADSATSNTNTTSWFYDSSNPGTPAFSSLTISPPGSPSYTYSSTVPHYNNTNIFTLTANVNRLSGNMYPTSDSFVTGTSGGAFGTPGSVTYSAAGVTTPLAQNLYVSSGNASISTTSTIISGFGASSTGPSLSSNNSYNSNTQAFTSTLAANVLYKTGTTSSASVIEEANVYVGSTIGSGSGLAFRIINPGSADTPVYTANAAAFNSQSSTLQTYDSTVVANILKHDQTNYSTGYLPAGPNLSSGRTGSQYFTFKIIRTSVSKFDVKWTGNIAGLWVALPGSVIDTTSSANGWLSMSTAYAGAGIPGVNAPGNGSDGCALGGVAPLNSSQTNKSVTATFGTESSSSTSTNEIYIRIKLTSGQSVTALSLQTASN